MITIQSGQIVVISTYHHGIDVTLVSRESLFAITVTHIPKLQHKDKYMQSKALIQTGLPWLWHRRHQKWMCWHQGPLKYSSHHQCARGMKLSAGCSQCPTTHYTTQILINASHYYIHRIFPNNAHHKLLTMSYHQSWLKSWCHQRTDNLTNILLSQKIRNCYTISLNWPVWPCSSRLTRTFPSRVFRL